MLSEDLCSLNDNDLLQARAVVEIEMRRRGLAFSVGSIGEELMLQFFNSTAGLANLQLAPVGTKNVDALSRNGDRYSMKTLLRSKKTGTVYPDPDNTEKVLFEYLLIAHLNDDFTLKSIHQFTWERFVSSRLWDKRMNAWYIGCSRKTLGSSKQIL